MGKLLVILAGDWFNQNSIAVYLYHDRDVFVVSSLAGEYRLAYVVIFIEHAAYFLAF